MTEQTVSTTPEVEPTQVSTENEPTAQDDLDALLNEYTEPVSEPAQPEVAQPTVSNDEMAEFRQMMAEQRTDKMNQGLNEAAKLVKTAAGESAANIPEWMMVGALREESTRNPNLEKIFNDRASNPEAWGKVAAALGKKISDELTPTDKASTSSWNAVDSALHSASTSTPTPAAQIDAKSMKGMDDQAFNTMRKEMGFIR